MIHRSIVCAMLVLAAAHRPVAAQSDSAKSADPKLFRGRDLLVVGGFTALTAAMAPFDRRLALRAYLSG